MLYVKRTVGAVLLLAALLETAPVQSQPYPAKPIRLIVPAAAGGPSDVLARQLAPQLAETLGAQVIVENRGGAGGNIGAELAARAPSDGYTLLLGSSFLASNPSLYRKLSYDPQRDFIAVAGLASVPMVLVVHPSMPVKTVKELIALARSRPGQLNYGHSGIGAQDHLCGELFRIAAEIKVAPVAFRGSIEAMNALVAGDVNYLFAGIAVAGSQVKAGKVRALAVTSPKRDPMWPDLPTVSETLPGFSCVGWNGIFVPAGVPSAVREKIERAVASAINTPAFRERMAASGLQALPSGDFPSFVRAESDKWAKVIRAAGMVVD